jgi:hypothetical protein
MGWGQNDTVANPLCNKQRVVAGNPAASLLTLAITTGDGDSSSSSGSNPTSCTEQMPVRYYDLVSTDVDLIRTWICQGASNN